MPNLTNGKKLGIGLGISGLLLTAAGAALALLTKKKSAECIECSDTDSESEATDTTFEEVEE